MALRRDAAQGERGIPEPWKAKTLKTRIFGEVAIMAIDCRLSWKEMFRWLLNGEFSS